MPRIARADDRSDCLQTANPDLAVRACTALLDHGTVSKDERVRAFTFRGLAHRAQKDFASAIDDYSQAIDLDPGNPDPLLKRAETRFDLSLELVANTLPSADLAQRAMAHSRDAEADFRRACALLPDCSQIETKLAGVLGSRSLIKRSGHWR